MRENVTKSVLIRGSLINRAEGIEMVGGIIITHGDIAQSLVRALEAITGPSSGLITLSVNSSDTPEDIKKSLSKAVKSADDGSGVIIFTDMFGGTPSNVALPLLGRDRVEIITGVNLPLLIKFCGHRSDKGIEELSVYLKEYGRSSIVLAGEMLKEKK